MKGYLKHNLTSEHIKQTEWDLNTIDESETGAKDLDESNANDKNEASWSPAPGSYLKSSMMMI